jgi:hypothetical protein
VTARPPAHLRISLENMIDNSRNGTQGSRRHFTFLREQRANGPQETNAEYPFAERAKDSPEGLRPLQDPDWAR